MYISVVLVCAIVICAGALLRWRGRRARSLFAHLPTYTELPILGNIYKLYGGGEALMRCFADFSRISDVEDLPFAMWAGPYPVLMFINPDDLRVVTNTFVDKPYYYNFGRIWLGNGLVTAPVAVWKRNIKKMAGTFMPGVVAGYQSVFNAQAQNLNKVLRAKVGSPPFDFMHDLAFITLEAICQTALGVPQISESIVTSEYYKAFNQAMRLLIERGLNLLLHFDLLYQLLPAHRQLEKCVAIIHNVSETVIAKRKEELKKNNRMDHVNEELTGSPEAKFKSFLDILLEMSETDPSLTSEQIKAEVNTVIVGGQETSATTLFFTFLMIGCNERVQDTLYAELQEIFGESDRPIEKEDLLRMRYCEAVVLETLRLFPPVPAVLRLADRDLQLKSCLVPKGTVCGVNMWGAGRSRRTWGADAHEYRPERWLAGEPRAGAFVSFSYGRRSCIGKKYAMALLKTIVAACAREYRFTSQADQLKLKIDLALRPVSGHLLQVHLRKPLDQAPQNYLRHKKDVGM